MLGESSAQPSEALGLQDLIDNPKLEEVWVNGPNQVFVAEGGVSRPVSMHVSAMNIRAFVERTLRFTGRRVDVSSPFVDASLPYGWHAEVGRSSQWSPPVVSHFLPTTLRIQVEARAQTVLR